MTWVHSGTMSDAMRDRRDSRSIVVGSIVERTPEGTHHLPSAEFVRLSQLRRLRECEQVAAVCYRVRGGDIEFLLVRTRGRGSWTFPKGSAEPGLTHAQAAALEAFEEAGVHGRIEEASFTQYVRRKRDSERKSTNRSGKKEFAVNAHLCEVLRLTPVQESNRNRTWFSIEQAARALQKGRRREGAAEFSRVIDKAVERIQRLPGGSLSENCQPPYEREQTNRLPGKALPEDGLQRVQFEALAENYGRQASFMPNAHGALRSVRELRMPVFDDRRRQVLPCEVLEFAPLRDKKAKALGSGTNSKG